MATSREGIVGIVARKVGVLGMDARGLEPDDFVDEARILYERLRPREVAVDVTGSALYVYALDPAGSFPGWDDTFSEVRGVEYPIDQRPEPIFLDPNEYRTLRTEAGLFLSLPNIVPASEEIRVVYTRRHTLTGGASAASTVPDGDDYAVAGFAAHGLCLALASRLNRERNNPALDADLALGFAERAGEARRAADDFLTDANRILGITGTEPAAQAGSGGGASSKPVLRILDADIPVGRSSGGWLTHGPRDR